MQLSHLNELVVLAQVRSFHQAAELLFSTQSSLSKHIMSLEKELGNKLFIRTARSVELTEFGEQFLPYAVRIVEIEREYTEKLLNKTPNGVKNLVIGVAPIISLYKFMPYLSSLETTMQGYKIVMIERDGESLANMLYRNECSIIVATASDVGNDGNLIETPFVKDTLVAVVPANHALAGKKSIKIKDLKGESYIHIGKNNDYDSALGTPKMTVQHCSHAVALVGKGVGVSVLPRKAAMNYVTEEVRFIELDPAKCVTVDLFYRKDMADSATREVVHFLVQHSSLLETPELLKY